MNKPQNGNALFLILIAVALFAALSYAVTQSGRGGSGIDREQAEIMAAEIIQHAGLMRQTIQRMQLISGCADEELNFQNDVILTIAGTVFYSAHDTVTPVECEVYSPSGGGLQPLVFDQAANTIVLGPAQVVHGAVIIQDIIFDTKGSSAADLIYVVRALQEEICLRINERLGITNPSGRPPIDNRGGTNSTFFGTFDGTGIIGDGASAAEIIAADGGCMNNGGDDFSFRMLLKAR